MIHYAVPNIPGAFPQTATLKLTEVTLPYVLEIANKDMNAVKENSVLKKGLNIIDGKIVYKPIADAHHFTFTEL